MSIDVKAPESPPVCVKTEFELPWLESDKSPTVLEISDGHKTICTIHQNPDGNYDPKHSFTLTLHGENGTLCETLLNIDFENRERFDGNYVKIADGIGMRIDDNSRPEKIVFWGPSLTGKVKEEYPSEHDDLQMAKPGEDFEYIGNFAGHHLALSSCRSLGHSKYGYVNEDCVGFRKGKKIVVLDGVGGAPAGHLAAHFAVKRLLTWMGSLREGLQEVSRKLKAYGIFYGDELPSRIGVVADMINDTHQKTRSVVEPDGSFGTEGESTVVVVDNHNQSTPDAVGIVAEWLDDTNIEIVSVGDGRWRLIRNGTILKRNKVQREDGTNNITSSLCHLMDPQFEKIETKKGDIIVISTDGYDQIDDATLLSVLSDSADSEEILAMLKSKVEQDNKNHDNCSIAIIQC